jgi:hypothetical protein
MSVRGASPVSSQDRTKKRRWFAAFGANSLLVSIILHVLFGVGATCLIVEHFQKKHVNFQATKAPAQHTEVEHKIELAKRNNVESAPPDLKRITTTDISAITLPDVPEVSTPDDTTPTGMAGVGEGLEEGTGTGDGGGNGVSIGGPPPPPFGMTDGPGLKGYLYDLKLTPDGTPPAKPKKQKKMVVTGNGQMNVTTYYQVLDQYYEGGLNDSLLSAYYKGKTPLYTTRFAIPNRPSGEAPAAFHLEDIVKPGLWVIHYHGRVQAPSAGDYRFVGWGDNVLVVKIDGVVVLDGGWSPLTKEDAKHQELPYVFSRYKMRESADGEASGHDNHLKIGAMFHLDGNDKGDASAPVDMDVLVGDDGGVCGFLLLVEKEGTKYEKASDGTPEYPFFQLDRKSPPTFSDTEGIPPYSTKPEPWKMADQGIDDGMGDGLGN